MSSVMSNAVPLATDTPAHAQRRSLVAAIHDGTLTKRQRELLVDLVYCVDVASDFGASATLESRYVALLTAMTPIS